MASKTLNRSSRILLVLLAANLGCAVISGICAIRAHHAYEATVPEQTPGDGPGDIPEIPVTIQVASDAPPSVVVSGWVEDPDAVGAVQQSLTTPYFRDTPAGRAALGEPQEAFLWKAVETVTGHPAKIHNQNPVGSCVSFGTARAFEKSLAGQIAYQGDRFEFKYLCEEAVYGGSRVEIGGGRIRGDGSIGAWAAKFVKQYGGIPRGTYGSYDLTSYDPGRCRSWGQQGVPDDLEPEVRKYPAGDAAMVTSWAEAKKALAQHYGIAVCSNQGFTLQRDGNGICRPRGSWAHCMSLDGFCTINGQEYGHLENSWGANAHTGPVGPGHPTTAGFWAEAGVIDRMLRQQDSWAFSAVKGFPVRRIDWFAGARRTRPDRLALHRPAPPDDSLILTSPILLSEVS